MQTPRSVKSRLCAASRGRWVQAGRSVVYCGNAGMIFIIRFVVWSGGEMSFSDEEYALRCDLAAVFRAMARLGMAEQIAGHNSVKVPESISGPEPMFLINARGYHFSEITASNLLLCRQDGTVVRGDGELRKVAFHIHAGIHVHNPSAV